MKFGADACPLGIYMHLPHPLPPFLPFISPLPSFFFLLFHLSPSLAFSSLSTYITFIKLIVPFPPLFIFSILGFTDRDMVTMSSRGARLAFNFYVCISYEWKVNHE